MENQNLQIMKGTKKYIVSNEKQLINPKGFSVASKVFIKTKIAIHTDTLENLPQCNVNLYAHKIK